MLFMLPHTLRLLNVWSTGTAADRFYWVYWPYETFFVNTLGFCATWLTVLMTAECFINVYSPGLSKQFCTKRNIIICYLIIFVLGMLMGSIYPLNRDVQYHNHCGKWKAIISTSESALMNTMERGHTIVNLFLTILIPVTLLCFLTAAIVWKFVFQRSTKSGVILKLSSEKRCVTRITLITTILLLVSELPAVPVFLYSFFSGPKVIHANKGLCIWHSVSHFLGICSASLSFFVYFFFSQRFRQTVLVAIKTLAKRICPNWSKNQNSLNTIPSQSEEKMQVNHRRRSSYMISDNNGLFSRNSKRRTSSSNGIYKQKSSMELENEATCMQLLSAIPSGPVSNV
uniref:G_PROTEIN_RECEP_F1_2 domain-containing protein n=1 Tax=Rhabditophanes sp. KR3021 TaxID=114890 RepID=A0AC35U5B2_9BILA